MKKSLTILALAVLAGCASSNQNSGPAVEMHITATNLSTDTLYFRGPMSAALEMTITNPTADTITLRSLDLRTMGGGSFFMRTGSTPVNKSIPPNSTATLTMSAWGDPPADISRRPNQSRFAGSPISIRRTARSRECSAT